METFNYLGRILDLSDDNWATVFQNACKARQVGSQIGKLLRRDEKDPQLSEIFYKAVVQTVLLFGADTWVLLPERSRNMKVVSVPLYIFM